MKNASFKNLISRYYAEQEISETRLQTLLDIQKIEDLNSEGINNKRFYLRNYFSIPRWSSLALVTLSLFLMISVWIISENTYRDIEVDIAKEITLNHHKELQPDYFDTNVNNLQIKMPKLDFKIINSEKLNLLSAKLLGARYCSIQGNIAAQLKYLGADNKKITIYQTRVDHLSKIITPGEYYKDNVKIKLWVEDNVLFGLAQNIE